MKLTKKIIDLIKEKTACGVSDEGDYYSIYVDNTCCEDFTLEISKGKDEVEDIISCCDNFDSDEHFKLWFGANNGEPQSARALLDNCEEIGEHLEQLADLLREVR